MDLITDVPSIKAESGTYEEGGGEILHEEIDIDYPDIKEECLAKLNDIKRTADIVLFAESYCGAMDLITDVPSIKAESGTYEEGGGEILHEEIDIDYPDIKEECLAKLIDTKRTAECGAPSEIYIPDIKKKCSIYLKNCFVYLERIDQGSGVEPETILTFKEDGRPRRNIHSNLSPRTSRPKSLPSKKDFSCPHCSHSYTRNSDLNRHIRTHTGEKPFTCSECGYSCSQKSALRSHIYTHRKDKLLTCSKCKYSCCHITQLRKHVLTHTGSKPFVCTKCNFSSAYKGDLTRHLSTHSGVKPFTCSECNRSFSLKSHLKVHFRIHSGEKPFACSDCNYLCVTKQRLLQHNLTHSKIKPFSCALCNYSCSEKSTLKYHLFTHSGIKPFSCAHCNYSGTFRCNLKRHLLSHTVCESVL